MSYSPYKYCRKELEAVIGVAFPVIKEAIARFDADGVVVTGSSGVALMSALVLYDIPVVLCRKRGENAHAGSGLESAPGHGALRLIFVDDFIESGDTLRTVDGACSRDGVEVVGVVEVRDCLSSRHAYFLDSYEMPRPYGIEQIPRYRRRFDRRLCT